LEKLREASGLSWGPRPSIHHPLATTEEGNQESIPTLSKVRMAPSQRGGSGSGVSHLKKDVRAVPPAEKSGVKETGRKLILIRGGGGEQKEGAWAVEG